MRHHPERPAVEARSREHARPAGRHAGLRRTVLVCLACLVCTLPGLVAPQQADALQSEPWEYGRAQLLLESGVTIEEINADYDTWTIDTLAPMYLVGLPDGIPDAVMIATLHADPRVAWAEYAYVNETPEAVRQMVVAIVGGTVDGFFEQGIYERLNLADIHMHTLGEGTSIAIIDTGVNTSHPAFHAASFLPGVDYIDGDLDPTDPANGLDDDGDGEIDEGAGHGTMVTGIAHFTAPGASILPIRALDDEGFGTTFSVAKGIRHAVEQDVDVINLSLGLTDYCNVLRVEIERAIAADILVVSAAGNDSTPSLLFPASLESVVAVAALDSVDVKANFSNFHYGVFVSAPGLGVLAPFGTDGYAIGAGTSFATPFVSGQALLAQAVHPAMSKPLLQTCMQQGVVDIYGIPANYPFVDKLGSGRFDGLATWLAAAPVAGAETPDGGLDERPDGPALDVEVRTLPGGRFEFRFPEGRANTLDIVSALGRHVYEADVAGKTRVRWEGSTAEGRLLPSGIYFLRVAGEQQHTVRRLLVMR